jgi:hypothetical protein
MIPFPYQTGQFGRRRLPVGAADPNFANVSLLLHMDGANNSTTFIDSSSSAKTVTANGDAKISTALSKFGGASGLFDGAGDFLSVPSSADFDYGSGDFTIEGWINPRVSSEDGYIVGRRTGDTATTIQWCVFLVGGLLGIDFFSTANTRITTQSHPTTVTVGAFSHFAVVRNGNNWKIYLEGIGNTGVTASGTVANAANELRIGQAQGGFGGGGFPLDGNIDELRITKGVARYTANFTPPSAPFPDS